MFRTLLLGLVGQTTAELFAYGVQQILSPGQLAFSANFSSNGAALKHSAGIKVVANGQGSDEWCAVAFNPSAKVYYVPFYADAKGQPQVIMTVDASSGKTVANVTMSMATTVSVLMYDAGSGLLYALPVQEGPNAADVLSIDPRTGETKVLGSFADGDISPCYASFVPASSAYPKGVFLFTTSDLWVDKGQAIQAWDVDKAVIINTANSSRGINSISVGPADKPTTAFAMSYYGGTAMHLLAMDWQSGKVDSLLQLKEQTYSGDPCVQAMDQATGMLYVVLPHGSVPSALLAINTTANPVSYEEYTVDANGWAEQGVWTLNWA